MHLRPSLRRLQRLLQQLLGRQLLLQARFVRAAFLASMAAGSLLITWTSLPYFDEEDIHPFVLEKLPLPLENLWLSALSVHVVSAAITLPLCLLLLSRRFLRRFPRGHRWLGRVVGVSLLAALVPAGCWLALVAKGGGASTLGFLLSGGIVGVATIRAVAAARRHDFAAHRRFMAHVLAQMSVAVTSRALLIALDVVNVDEDFAYLISLWLPVVGSAWLAERVSRRPVVVARRSRDESRVLPALVFDVDPVR